MRKRCAFDLAKVRCPSKKFERIERHYCHRSRRRKSAAYEPNTDTEPQPVITGQEIGSRDDVPGRCHTPKAQNCRDSANIKRDQQMWPPRRLCAL
jgi:hypothetical protein